MPDNSKDTIYQLELSLLEHEIRANPEILNSLIADDFIEIGSSGKIYSKSDILNILPTIEPFEYRISEFNVREIADNLVLAIYQIELKHVEISKSLRSSLWKRCDNGWKIIFHQGTELK